MPWGVPPRRMIALAVDNIHDPDHDAKRLFGRPANAEAPLDLSCRDEPTGRGAFAPLFHALLEAREDKILGYGKYKEVAAR